MAAIRAADRKSPAHSLRWALMLPILLLATAIASQGLNADLIWYDELTSIGHAGGSTGPFSPIDVMDAVRERSPKHAPLFFELLSGWSALVGWHHAALRTLSLYFGVISLAWLYRIGADFVDVRTGLWASAFLGLNVFWLDYFHEIRMYPLQGMLVTGMIWHYFYLVRANSPPRWHHWTGLVLSASLSLYAQPYTILVHLSLMIYHLLFVNKSKTWFLVAAGILAAGCAYLPWLPVTLTGLASKFDTAYTAMTLEQTLGVFVRLFSNGNWIILLLLLMSAGLRLYRRHRPVLPFWTLAILILLCLLIVNESVGLIPVRRARYFFISWGMWAIVIGSGLAWIKRAWVALAILAIYLASGFVLRDADDYIGYQGTVSVVSIYPPMADYVEALRGKTLAHDFVVGFTRVGFVNRRGKHGKSTGDYYMETLLGIDGTFISESYDAQGLDEDNSLPLEDNPYLLFTYNPTQPPASLDLVDSRIKRQYQLCQVVLDEPSLFVQRYVYHSLDCNRKYEPIHYDNGVTIVDKFAEYDAEQNTVRVVTGWEVADESQLEEYNVSIQIITPEWTNVRQAGDRHLYHDVLKWYVVEMTTADLPPGDYRAVVILYDRYQSSAKVNGTDATTGEVGTILPVLHFTIDN